jgi:endonuclease/exonuclease/phosphatase family metal-dependent hydrolase
MKACNSNLLKSCIGNFSAWILILSMLLIQITTACKTAEEDGAGLRVMSFNIAAGHGDIDGIVRVIEEYSPDVVALQEVDVHWSERSDFADQARYLGDALGMHYFFGEIYTFEAEERNAPARQYGLGYLSKEPFVHRQNHLLTRLSTQTPEPELMILPGFPEVAVEIMGKPVNFFNSHLDYRRDPAVRLMQSEEMIQIMERVDGPRILMGDLNARPGAEEIGSLFEILDDAWTREDDPGYTFPADQPDRRIDYILHSGHFEVKQVFVVETEASDHRPVIADLLFKSD